MGKLASDEPKKEKVRKKDRHLPTKIVIRRLPPTLTIEEFKNELHPLPEYDYFQFVAADYSLGHQAFTTAYINFKEYDEVFEFRNKFDGYVFLDPKGIEYSAVVEFAPCQQVPRMKKKKDHKCAMIDKDPDYLQFLEQLEKEEESLPSAEIYIEEIEARKAIDKKKEKIVTPLIEFLKEKRESRIAARQAAIAQREKERKARIEKEREKRRDKEREREKKVKVDQKKEKHDRSRDSKRTDEKKDIKKDEVPAEASEVKDCDVKVKDRKEIDTSVEPDKQKLEKEKTRCNEKDRGKDRSDRDKHTEHEKEKSRYKDRDRYSERDRSSRYGDRCNEREKDRHTDRGSDRYQDDRYYDDKYKRERAREKSKEKRADAKTVKEKAEPSNDRSISTEKKKSDTGKQSRTEQVKTEEQNSRRTSIEYDDPSILSFTEQADDMKSPSSDGSAVTTEKATKPDQSDTEKSSLTKNSKRPRPEMKIYRPPSERSFSSSGRSSSDGKGKGEERSEKEYDKEKRKPVDRSKPSSRDRNREERYSRPPRDRYDKYDRHDRYDSKYDRDRSDRYHVDNRRKPERRNNDYSSNRSYRDKEPVKNRDKRPEKENEKPREKTSRDKESDKARVEIVKAKSKAAEEKQLEKDREKELEQERYRRNWVGDE